MKKRIVISLLLLQGVNSIRTAENPTDFAAELEQFGDSNSTYNEDKTWFASLATTCADHMPEAAMVAAASAVCIAYCKYDDFKEWSSTLKPRFIALIERCKKWLRGKKQATQDAR